MSQVALLMPGRPCGVMARCAEAGWRYGGWPVAIHGAAMDTIPYPILVLAPQARIISIQPFNMPDNIPPVPDP